MNTIKLTPELEAKVRAEIKAEDEASAILRLTAKNKQNLYRAKWRIRLNDAQTPEEKDKVRRDLRYELYEENDFPSYGYERATKDLQIILGEYYKRPEMDLDIWIVMIFGILFSAVISFVLFLKVCNSEDAVSPITSLLLFLSVGVLVFCSFKLYRDTHQPYVLQPDD